MSPTSPCSRLNTQFYRLFGPGYPEDGQPFDKQVIKSAFELDLDATVPAAHTVRPTGRSWSANGPIRHVDVSVDGGRRWRWAVILGLFSRWNTSEIGWNGHRPDPLAHLPRHQLPIADYARAAIRSRCGLAGFPVAIRFRGHAPIALASSTTEVLAMRIGARTLRS